jgi:hypothetical protein
MGGVYKVIIEKDWGWSGYTREGLRFSGNNREGLGFVRSY